MDKFNFFPGARRKISLDDWAPKLNTENEKRILLQFIMPLTGQPLVGMPGAFNEALVALDKENSAVDESSLSTELEGVTMEVWATDSSPKHDHLITAATLRKFQLVRKREKDETIVSLKFNCTVQSNEKLLLWAYRNHGATMWIEFTETQASIPAPDDQMNLSEQKAPAPADPEYKGAYGSQEAEDAVKSMPTGKNAAKAN